MSVCAVDDDKSAKMVGVGGNAFSSIVAGELMGHVEQLVVCPEETGRKLQVATARQESFGIGIAPLEMKSNEQDSLILGRVCPSSNRRCSFQKRVDAICLRC